MKFTERDHARLARLFNGRGHGEDDMWGAGEPYAGYKPDVREAPNGDTKACPECTCTGLPEFRCLDCMACKLWSDGCDTCNGTGRVPNVDDGRAAKRYLHVAPKYNPPQWAADYYDRAFAEACRVATALGVPAAYRPHEAYGALRVLEYPSAAHRHVPDRPFHCDECGRQTHALGTGPGGVTALDDGVCPALAPGAGTVEHKDYDLFSIVLWRSTPEDLERTPRIAHRPEDWAAEAISPGLHIGLIGELVGLGPATPHRVPARPYAQKSLIYFAIPDHAARLPVAPVTWSGVRDRVPTVGQWLAEYKKLTRYEVQP